MNSASENLDHHLSVLRERLLHPTDYEKAFHYFLDEFGGDQKFISLGEVEEAPNLVAVLGHIASQAFGRKVGIERGSCTIPTATHSVTSVRIGPFYRGSSNFCDCSFIARNGSLNAPKLLRR